MKRPSILNFSRDDETKVSPLAPAAAIFVLALILLSGGTYVWAQNFEGRIGPKVMIAGIDVSGMDPEEARAAIQERIDALVTNGITVHLEDEEAVLPLATLVTGDIFEDVEFDLDSTIEEAKRVGRYQNPLLETAHLAVRQIGPIDVVELSIPVELNKEALTESVRRVFPDRETEIVNASFNIHYTHKWVIEAVEGSPGITFDFDPFFAELESQLTYLDDSGITIGISEKDPEVSLEMAEAAVETAEGWMDFAPVRISYEPLHGLVHRWRITSTDLSKMLEPTADEEMPVQLSVDAVNAWFDVIAPQVEQEAKDAKLDIEDGRVNEFVASENGLAIDREASFQEIADYFINDEPDVVLVVEQTEPKITLGSLNDIGLSEVLGVGTSSYRGSPANRIKNIRNGVALLNGTLIAPGDTFSLTKSLSPFTFENGYLPELVIKGDKIEPELGGGLCQIGTTTFRATMNAGLPVTERRNHSLVVSYYNDPMNGNPGTDATIYEPAPDYKFTNDTENYVLFQAEMLPATQQLRFTFWGTNDGRRGSYTAPVVHRWIPTGETKEIETTDLEPGERKCQGAHIGADASFTYTIVRPDGEKEETVYESHYRPLPEICLVGVAEEGSEEGAETEEATEEQTETPEE